MYNAARIIGIFFGLSILLGYLWYLKYHGLIETTYFVTTLLALWVVPVIPRRYYLSTYIKYLVRFICGIAVIATVPMLYKDLTMIYGADYSAAILRSLIILIELVLLTETIKRTQPTR